MTLIDDIRKDLANNDYDAVRLRHSSALVMRMDAAPEIKAKIEAAKPKVQEALQDES